jgi:hypothetical protein
MKTDPQHLLPAHVQFYRRKLFWGVMLFLIFTLPYIYIIYQYSEHTQLQLILSMVNIFIPLIIFGQLFQFGYSAYIATFVLYIILLYFSLFRKKINFFVLGILFILMAGSLLAIINFVEHFV